MPEPAPPVPGRDHDGDGDYDGYDYAVEQLLQNPGSGMGQVQEEITDLFLANALHEFLEDIGELNDGVEGNDSFFDGGLGENDLEPVDGPADPPGSIQFVYDGAAYSLEGGVFTYLGGGNGPIWSGGSGGGGGGGGGDDTILGG
ncbi:MAG TPA: hypothetical protein VEF55_03860 [Candidatus Binatia bacterium]|nr:hypothetical protein [Candidatus Binatia bacterium]